jgi:putative addiction module component (TIGR02574 family)
MALTVSELTQEAMQLPSPLRAQLAQRLVESLDDSEIDQIEQIWAAEAIRRRDDIRSGRVQPVDGETVLKEVRRSVAG